ncbi:MAG TPA: lipopolysaccharide biosynthesis protein [Actinomycetota bacterium]|nr:lipopolysaccharide biosynthesis protein [Actinomycetota bacterium]
MRSLQARFRRDTAGAVAGLSVATAIGQGLSLLAAPILARLVSPADFAVFGVYIALFSWLASIVCLRYEQAIVLPADDEDGAGVFSLALLSAVAVSACALVLVIGFGAPISRALGVPSLHGLLPLLPVGLLATGAVVAMNYLALRRKTYGPVMRSKIAQGVGTAAGQISLTAAGMGGPGLVVGDVIGRITGVLPYLRLHGLVDAIRSASTDQIRRLARRYRRFPLISGPSSLINSAGLVAPVLLLTALFGARVGGLYTVALRLVGGPLDLVAASVAQVYVAQFGELLRTGEAMATRRLFRTYTFRLLKWGALPVLALAVLAPWLFGLVLGARWQEAGEFTRVLTPLFLADFAAYPLSQTLNLLERQGLQFAWDTGRLLGVIASIAIGHALGWSALTTVAVLGVTMAAFYALLAVLGYRVLVRHTDRLAPAPPTGATV